jgi:Fic family protein
MAIQPPFKLTAKILKLSQSIAHELGILTGAKLTYPRISLRRENKIRTIHSSLAIEGNTLDIKQITALIDGQKVLGPSKDILEVNNAIAVYSKLSAWNPLSMPALLQAHKTLMEGLIDSNGKWRTKGVGIFKGKQVAHVPPPASRIAILMQHLFNFIKQNPDIPWLIKACVFHYELEFIHPFSDGNGRMGRLWQQLILMKEHPLFEFISVEEVIKRHQQNYYKALEKSDRAGDSTLFIEFSLEQILDALKQYSISAISTITDPNSRLEYSKNIFGGNWFTRKAYIHLLKNISTATASRDLQKGVEHHLLTKKGEKNRTQYQFKERLKTKHHEHFKLKKNI